MESWDTVSGLQVQALTVLGELHRTVQMVALSADTSPLRRQVQERIMACTLKVPAPLMAMLMVDISMAILLQAQGPPMA